MKNQPKIRIVMLGSALVIVTATAWATNGSLSNSIWVPSPTRSVTTEPGPVATPAEPVTVTDSLAPNESVMVPRDSTVAPAMPRETTTTTAPLTPRETITTTPAAPFMPAENIAVPLSAPQPPITIEERRLSLDERIQADVIDRLVSTPYLSGKIGVESHDAIVTLTGYTATAGQARRAEHVVRSVEGVRYVQNQIRARIGGSV